MSINQNKRRLIWKYHRHLQILCIIRRWTRGKKTVKNYRLFLTRFNDQFDDRNIENLTPDEILAFITKNSKGQKQSTKRLKFTLLKAFFNFCISATGFNFLNPCDAPVFKKSFRAAKGHSWTILEKDVVDEIIFKTEKPRNRLILELMARGGMRIGEVLKLRAMDVDERKLLVKESQ